MDDRDLVRRLRDREGFVLEGPRRLMQACEEAADSIDRLLKANAARVADLADAKHRIEDAETALATWDGSRSSEYWLRHPVRATGTAGERP